MKILVTGTAGFIGSHVAKQLLARGDIVIGLDNLNDYYDVSLKRARLEHLLAESRYLHNYSDLADRTAVEEMFAEHKPERVIHLAAQAGVRYAATNPHIYVQSNITGFLHILEGCRRNAVQHLVFASTSSVYGANTDMPFTEHKSTEHPLTLYAASKKANEMMAHSYSHLYAIPCTGLRFFTVYGPWGRPDMALFLFTKAILADEPIKVFNYGKHSRSFTYVDDIVEGVIRACDQPAVADVNWDSEKPDPASSNAPYRIYNIGNSQTIPLMKYGDVLDTTADCSDLESVFGYSPKVNIEEGVTSFVNWYKQYYL